MTTRNTARNVSTAVWERLRGEFHRAHRLIEAGRPFSAICAPVRNEPDYIAGQAERDAFARPPRNPVYQPNRPPPRYEANGSPRGGSRGGRGRGRGRGTPLSTDMSRNGSAGSNGIAPPPPKLSEHAFPALAHQDRRRTHSRHGSASSGGRREAPVVSTTDESDFASDAPRPPLSPSRPTRRAGRKKKLSSGAVEGSPIGSGAEGGDEAGMTARFRTFYVD